MPIKTRLVSVTPSLAEEWLDKNANNRPISRQQVEAHKRRLLAGDFRTTHQGIAFDAKGRLRDGQHRLMAIVETGVPAQMLVTEGLTEQDIQAIDDGRKRTTQDMLSMTNRERVSLLTTAITREMYIGGWHLQDGVKRRAPLRQDLVSFYKKHAEAIEYAAEALRSGSSGVSIGYVGAAIARAYGHLSRRKMDQFTKTLTTGMTKDDDMDVVIKLRNFLMRKLREGARKISTRDEIYGKVEQVLYSWSKGEELASLRSAKTELFPLDGEEIPAPPQSEEVAA